MKKTFRRKNGVEVIQDTGIGIRPEALPTLLDPFHPVDTGGTRADEKVRSGLKMVKDLVDLLQGAIKVESQYGRGSTFTVFLPYTWRE